MTDSPEKIHERSVRLVANLNSLNSGEIDLDEMMRIIDDEEETANLTVDKKEAFDAFREMANLVFKKAKR